MSVEGTCAPVVETVALGLPGTVAESSCAVDGVVWLAVGTNLMTIERMN